MKLFHYQTPHTKINSEWIKSLNVRPEDLKLLEQNTGGKLLYNDLLDFMPREKKTKAKINKWDYIKLKSFCTSEETINKMRKPTKWKKILANYIFNK